VGGMYLQLVFRVPLEDHEILVVEDEIDSLVEGGKDVECLVQLLGLTARASIAARRLLAQRDEMQHLLRQHIANARYGADGAAVDVAVEHLGVDADQQHHRSIIPRNVLRRVAKGCGSAELFEPNEVGVPLARSEEHTSELQSRS